MNRTPHRPFAEIILPSAPRGRVRPNWKVLCAGLLIGLAMVVRAQESVAVKPAVAEESSERAAFAKAMQVFQPALDAPEDRGAVDFAKLRAAMEEYWAHYPTVHQAQTLLTYYMRVFARAHPDAQETEWARFVHSSSPLAATLAQDKVRYFAMIKAPLVLKFTAVDGRAVDLAKLRGKVVFLNFWATWCVPCRVELPGLKQVYARHHQEGFEIVGIAMEAEADQPKLLNFIAREKLPWPQHFDGRGWDNEIARQFAINSIPTTLLLDKTGRVAVTDPDAKKLEAEVERLLNSPK